MFQDRNFNNFRVLTFYGRANDASVAFTKDFDMQEIKDRILTIKRIAFIPYAGEQLITDYMEDITNSYVYKKSVPAGSRIKPEGVESYALALQPIIKINGMRLSFFTTSLNGVGYPLDLNVDNIFVVFPSPCVSIDVFAYAEILDNPPGDSDSDYPFIKCIMEVYLNDSV